MRHAVCARDAGYDTHRDMVNRPVLWRTQITDDERLEVRAFYTNHALSLVQRCCGLVVG